MYNIMKFQIISIFIALIIMFNALYVNSCWKKNQRTQINNQITASSFQGNELDEFLFIENYEIKNFVKPDLFSNIPSTARKILSKTGKIKLEIFVSRHNHDDIITCFYKIVNVMEEAKNHLKKHFLTSYYDSHTYDKILVCCIEFALRARNKENNLSYNPKGCLSILGLDGNEKDFTFTANIWNENMVIEILF